MLVRICGDPELSGAEQNVVRFLQGLSAVPGVALFNVNVPQRSGKPRRQVDGVIFTPHGCVVFEVKGFFKPQSGRLIIPPNDVWTIDGDPAALYSSGRGTPIDQVQRNVWALLDSLKALGRRPFVNGLVIVLPLPHTRVTIAPHQPPEGIAVILGSTASIADYLHGLDIHPASWTAADVTQLGTALNLGRWLPSKAQLTAEGFAAASSTPRAAPVVIPGRAPTRPTKTRAPALAPTRPTKNRAASRTGKTARPRSRPRNRRRRSKAKSFFGSVVLIVVVLGALLFALNFLGNRLRFVPPVTPITHSRPAHATSTHTVARATATPIVKPPYRKKPKASTSVLHPKTTPTR